MQQQWQSEGPKKGAQELNPPFHRLLDGLSTWLVCQQPADASHQRFRSTQFRCAMYQPLYWLSFRSSFGVFASEAPATMHWEKLNRASFSQNFTIVIPRRPQILAKVQIVHPRKSSTRVLRSEYLIFFPVHHHLKLHLQLRAFESATRRFFDWNWRLQLPRLCAPGFPRECSWVFWECLAVRTAEIWLRRDMRPDNLIPSETPDGGSNAVGSFPPSVSSGDKDIGKCVRCQAPWATRN